MGPLRPINKGDCSDSYSGIDNLLILRFDTRRNMKSQASKADQTGADTPDWSKTKTPNLIRYNPSGVYYMRVRVAGKLHVKSLETDVYTVAQQRLPDKVKPLRAAVEIG